jgi:hypothetical protein
MRPESSGYQPPNHKDQDKGILGTIAALTPEPDRPIPEDPGQGSTDRQLDAYPETQTIITENRKYPKHKGTGEKLTTKTLLMPLWQSWISKTTNVHHLSDENDSIKNNTNGNNNNNDTLNNENSTVPQQDHHHDNEHMNNGQSVAISHGGTIIQIIQTQTLSKTMEHLI